MDERNTPQDTPQIEKQSDGLLTGRPGHFSLEKLGRISRFGIATEQAADPPVVLPPIDTAEDSHFFRDAGDWLDRILGGESYGAPRVFDLFTMLAITLAFALLFAALRMIEPLLLSSLEIVATCLGIFVTGIGLFQLALFGGKLPRLASLVAGPILWILMAGAIHVFSPATMNSSMNASWIPLVVFSSILGVPAGYLAGGMVAGVFLLADFFRIKYLKNQVSNTLQNDDKIFAETDSKD